MAKATGSSLSLYLWPLEAVRFGVDVLETALAAQQVVSARLPVMARALHAPHSGDRPELTRMVSEKILAFGRSGKSAVAAHDVITRAAASNARAWGRVAGGGIIWPADCITLAEDNIAACVALASLPSDMLNPIHRTVIANKRRLR